MENTFLPCDERTLCNVRRDFTEWHRSRKRYALWALNLHGADIDQRMRDAQAHLADYLLDGYQRQPHITLSLCGFPSASPALPDDFGAETLLAQLSALRQLRPAPFDIAIGDLDSFSSVPYLQVQADKHPLMALRQCLASPAAQTPQAPYTAHVTVGLYGGVWPMAALRAQFKSFGLRSALARQITGISLVSYTAADIGGPLQTLAEFDFASGALQWSDVAPALPAPFQRLRQSAG
jgi:2'-5' RNA ligase